MSSSPRRLLPPLTAALLASLALAACSPTMAAGGMTGGLISALLLVFLLVGSTTTQAGCDRNNHISIGPCLSPVPIEPPEELDQGAMMAVDQGAEAVDQGGDMGEARDLSPPVTPCLSIQEPSVGPCLSQVAPRGPRGALTLPPQALDPASSSPSPQEERAALLKKLEDRLPQDVVARLRGQG